MLNVDLLLQVADQLVVGKVHSYRELLLTRISLSGLATMMSVHNVISSFI